MNVKCERILWHVIHCVYSTCIRRSCSAIDTSFRASDRSREIIFLCCVSIKSVANLITGFRNTFHIITVKSEQALAYMENSMQETGPSVDTSLTWINARD